MFHSKRQNGRDGLFPFVEHNDHVQQIHLSVLGVIVRTELLRARAPRRQHRRQLRPVEHRNRRCRACTGACACACACTGACACACACARASDGGCHHLCRCRALKESASANQTSLLFSYAGQSKRLVWTASRAGRNHALKDGSQIGVGGAVAAEKRGLPTEMPLRFQLPCPGRHDAVEESKETVGAGCVGQTGRDGRRVVGTGRSRQHHGALRAALRNEE
jgi:hypothetical protein